MKKINIGKITQNIPAVKCFPDAPVIVFLHLNMKKKMPAAHIRVSVIAQAIRIAAPASPAAESVSFRITQEKKAVITGQIHCSMETDLADNFLRAVFCKRYPATVQASAR